MHCSCATNIDGLKVKQLHNVMDFCFNLVHDIRTVFISTNYFSVEFPGLQIHDTCNIDDLTRKHLYHVITAATRDVTSSVAGRQQQPSFFSPTTVATTATKRRKSDSKLMQDLGLSHSAAAAAADTSPTLESLGPPLLGNNGILQKDAASIFKICSSASAVIQCTY